MSKDIIRTVFTDQKMLKALNSHKSFYRKNKFNVLYIALAAIILVLVIFNHFYKDKYWHSFYKSNYSHIANTHKDKNSSLLAELSILNNYDSIINPVEIEKINLNIGFKNWEAIKADRTELKKTGRHPSLLDSHKVIIDWKGESYKAKIRHVGIGNDHREHPKKWSFLIKIKNDKYINGMSEFKLYNPKTRSYWSECLFLNSLRYNNILAPACDQIEIYINGDKIGIMTAVESINKNMLERQGRKAGVVFKPGYQKMFYDLGVVRRYAAANPKNFLTKAEKDQFISNIDRINLNRVSHPLVFYSKKSIAKNKMLAGQKKEAIKLFNAMLDAKIPISGILDVDKFGAALATVFFWGDYHSFQLHNLRFYFNPITYKIEPIPTDGQAVAHDSGIPRFNNGVKGTHALFYWLTRSSEIRQSFRKHVEKYASSMGSDGLFGKQFEELKRNQLSKLLVDYKMLPSIYSAGFKDRYNTHKNKIAVDNFFQEPSETYKRIRFVPPNDYDVIDAVHAYIINDGVDKYVEILNNFPGRAVLRKLISTDGDNVKTLLEKIPFDQIDQSGLQIPPTYPGFDPKNGRRVGSLKFDLGEEKFSNDSVFSGIIWLENQNKEYKFTATPYFSAAKENPVTPTPLTEIIHKNSFIKYGKEDNSVRIPRGKWTVKDFIKLPEGISLILESGASVEFEKNAGILVRAHVDLQGSSTHPIVLKPVDMADGWAGLTVMNANQWDRESRSILKNVTVSKTNAAHFGTWKLTGGVNFYNSNVDIINVKFERSMAEDSLNIIHSDFLIKEVVISDSHSDAFDGDFVNGSVMNSQFKSIGGDAIDISGSNIQLSDSTFEFVKDKAISVGEASNLKASGLVIKSSGTGVASKDGSSAHITNSTFKDIGYSTLMAYTKKKQYGRATLVADDINYEPRFNAIVAQKKSGIILNGTLALSRKIDIDKLYQDGYMKK
jgi:hypothetical protein